MANSVFMKGPARGFIQSVASQFMIIYQTHFFTPETITTTATTTYSTVPSLLASSPSIYMYGSCVGPSKDSNGLSTPNNPFEYLTNNKHNYPFQDATKFCSDLCTQKGADEFCSKVCPIPPVLNSLVFCPVCPTGFIQEKNLCVPAPNFNSIDILTDNGDLVSALALGGATSVTACLAILIVALVLIRRTYKRRAAFKKVLLL